MNSRAQVRNQLLQSDIGNIDLSHEVPNGPAPPRQYPQMLNRPAQPQYNPNRYTKEDPERRAYSLNQKSITGFFKNRGGKMPHRRGREDGSKDEDEEVMVDGDLSTMTFNDIRTSQNRGGEKYGYGGDTAPIIPTLVTQSHNNMNNVEYRKHMTAQRKYAMNAMAKQQKPDARAMSLQGYNSGNPYQMHTQYQMAGAQGPYGNSRANSMVQPPPQLQRNGYLPYGAPGGVTNGPPNGPPNGPSKGPPNGPSGPLNGPPNRGPMQNGPRAMSLMTPYSRSPMRPQHELYQPPQQVHRPPHGLSSENLVRQPSELYQPSQQPYGQPRGSSSENLPGQSYNSSQYPQQANRQPPAPSMDPSPRRSPGSAPSTQLNVLQLSAPQQNDLKEKERLLLERERELKEKERLMKEQEATFKRELEQNRSKSTSEAQYLQANHEDVNLDPSPTLENGLRNMSVNDRTTAAGNDSHNRVSTGTFVSAFSASPEKQRTANPSGMYQLEKHDNNAFVTAQEFPETAENKPSETFDDTIDEENSTLTSINRPERNEGSSAAVEQRKKRSSLIKAKDFLRKLSTNSLNKDNDSQLGLNKTSSRASMRSIPGSEAPQYRPAAKREPSVASIRKNKAEDDLAKHSESNDDPDAFIFDNTVGKAYVPSFAAENEVIESDKFKTITISGEQLNVLTENKELMGELTLVSTELAESIKRETILEEQLRTLNDPSQAELQLSLADFEIELRKKSSKIVELIQQLNNERLKRFIAEEQVLLNENGVKPSALDFVNRITTLEGLLEAKDNEISRLKDQLL